MLGQCFDLPCRQLEVVGIKVTGGNNKAGCIPLISGIIAKAKCSS
jgi:hypothetical protein